MIPFRKFISKGSPPKFNHPDEIKDDIGQGEARRQMEVFHAHIYAPHEPNPDYDPNDKYDSPTHINPDRQDTSKRDFFYKAHGLRAPRADDEVAHPRVVANYLDHMHHYFPEVAKHFNMEPMEKGKIDALVDRQNRQQNTIDKLKRSTGINEEKMEIMRRFAKTLSQNHGE